MFESLRNLTPFGATTLIVDVVRIALGVVFIVQFPEHDNALDATMPSIVYIRAGVLALILFVVMTPAVVRMFGVGYEHYIGGPGERRYLPRRDLR